MIWNNIEETPCPERSRHSGQQWVGVASQGSRNWWVVRDLRREGHGSAI